MRSELAMLLTEPVHYSLALAVGLLSLIAVVAVLARRLAVSYPILLLIAGLICAILPQIPDIPLLPDVVFYVFLPPLLYSAAWQTSWREFRYNIVSISMLAVGLVMFTAVGVALLAHVFLPGFDWRLGFLLGAIASPTDAVAATSIARRMGLPHALVDLLEGESLVNDATGLLALQFGIELITGGQVPTVSHALLQFCWLVVGGILVGLLIGWVVFFLERWVEEGPVEIALSLVVAYISYVAGEAVHASGVIAVVVCGLYLSRRSSQSFSAESRLQITAFWHALEFLLNGLIFLLIGMQLSFVLKAIQGYSIGRLCLYGAGFAAVLIALRLLWVYPAAHASYVIRTKLLGQKYTKPSRKDAFVLGWTGMRGVVALAAAGSVPEVIGHGQPFPQRGVILFLTFAVILVTLVLQGLSLPAIVRLLGFQKDQKPQCEKDEARLLLLNSGISFLEQREPPEQEDKRQAVGHLLHVLRRRRAELEDGEGGLGDGTSSRDLLVAVYRRQREELQGLRESGRIGDAVYREVERELDLGELRALRQG